jgi:hypothetical protein
MLTMYRTKSQYSINKYDLWKSYFIKWKMYYIVSLFYWIHLLYPWFIDVVILFQNIWLKNQITFLQNNPSNEIYPGSLLSKRLDK